MTSPTIYALSSGAGRAGVAVIRVSGPATSTVLQTLTGSVAPDRQATLCSLRSASDGHVIDQALVLFFASPNSFTGEDVAEFQVHGSPAVVRRMLEELDGFEGTELATPGAFTERAFLNGKLDLTEVEGLADLIDADTELQRRQALAQSSGVLRHRSGQWRGDLIHALALIEAVLDFSDEGDITDGPIADAQSIIQKLTRELETAVAGTARAEAIRNGYRIAIVGAPNAGKSSLLNALAARDVAIVTAQAGTTRDTIEVQLELAGLPVTLVDTAGLRETDNLVEREGIIRAHKAVDEADLVIHLIDATAPAKRDFGDRNVWHVLNKIDSFTGHPQEAEIDHQLSATTGRGVGLLIDALTDWAKQRANLGEAPIVTRERQRQCLTACLTSFEKFTNESIDDLELRAQDLRSAAITLGQLTGEIDAEEVLDDIFAGFCIGK